MEVIAIGSFRLGPRLLLGIPKVLQVDELGWEDSDKGESDLISDMASATPDVQQFIWVWTAEKIA